MITKIVCEITREILSENGNNVYHVLVWGFSNGFDLLRLICETFLEIEGDVNYGLGNCPLDGFGHYLLNLLSETLLEVEGDVNYGLGNFLPMG